MKIPVKYWLKFFQYSAFLPMTKGRRPAKLKFMSATDPVVLELAALKNLGEKTALWLVDAGVRSRSEMAKLGAIEVCRRMLLAGHPVSLVAAYAIEGALTDTHWNQIPPQKKLEVQRLFAVMKRGIAAGPPVVKAGARAAAKTAADAAAAVAVAAVETAPAETAQAATPSNSKPAPAPAKPAAKRKS
jgi:DNA transformation protein